MSNVCRMGNYLIYLHLPLSFSPFALNPLPNATGEITHTAKINATDKTFRTLLHIMSFKYHWIFINAKRFCGESLFYSISSACWIAPKSVLSILLRVFLIWHFKQVHDLNREKLVLFQSITPPNSDISHLFTFVYHFLIIMSRRSQMTIQVEQICNDKNLNLLMKQPKRFNYKWNFSMFFSVVYKAIIWK